MAKLDQIELPNGVTYDFDDKYARKLTNNDFDTINVTELNAGDLIVTGVGRFTNGLYGNLIGNASTATLATTASKLSNTSKIGDTNKPVYFTASGVPSAVSYTLGAACEKGVDTTVKSGSSNLVTSGAVYTAIDNLPEPMVFKGTLGTGGTITSLPTAAAANEGFTYKVITAGTYASQTAKVGDVFVSNGSSWVLIPSGDTDSDTWRSIKVNGTEKLTSAISSGAVDFVNGTNTTVNFNTTGSKISINSVNTTYSLSASGESVVLSGSDNTSSTANLSSAFANYMPKAGGTFTGRVVYNNVSMPLAAGKVTGLTAGTTEIFKDAIAFSNPATSNDLGWIRVLGTGESDTVLEIATGDDGGGSTAEKIVARQYNTSNAIANEATLLDKSGNTTFPKNVTATKFIGALQGNADTATKLATARTINIGNDLQGSATFDGSGDITIDVTNYSCSVGGANKANYPWHRFAYKENITSTYYDSDAIFDIRSKYNEGSYGRLKVSLRTNYANAAVNISATWIYRYNCSASDVKIACWGVTGQAVYIDVFIKCATYPRLKIYQPEGDRIFTLVDSYEVADTTSSDPKTSYEVYKTIEDAGTTLHNQSYTQIVAAIDGGVVNSATTATNLSGFTNTTTSGTAVDSATQNGHVYVTGTSGIYSQKDGAAFVQAYSTSWVAQIYQDYRTGQIALRGKNNGTWKAWRKVWDSVNLTSKTAAASGTDLSLVTTGEKATWNAKPSTDTKNTAGSTDTSSKIFLIGATSQAANPQTYSDDQVYVTSGVLSTNGHTSTGNIVLSSSSGNSPQLQFLRGSSLTKWRIYVASGQLQFDSSTDGSTWTTRAYFADNSGNFNCASVNASTLTASTHITATGNVVGAYLGISGTSGTSGGISLYNGASYTANYGIAFRRTGTGTGEMGKHGYVQGDWATYFTMDGTASNRGWVFRHASSGNVASITADGNQVLNGSLTLGGNTTNTSGVRQVYNSTTKSLDFVFVA